MKKLTGAKRMWMVRSDGGQLIETFLEKNIVSIGWGEVGSLSSFTSRDQVINKVKETWPEYKPMKSVVIGSQLNKIFELIKVGDSVITYDPSKRIYHVGKIIGEYQFDPNAKDATAHKRKVKWEGDIERDKLSVPTKNTLGSTLSIFEISGSAEKEIISQISGKPSEPKNLQNFVETSTEDLDADVITDTKDIFEEMKSKAKEFIKDKVIALDWDEMQQIIAGTLRAMGYKTRISPHGSDRGKDIVASPDGLGLEQPRIVVEVKHRPNSQMGSQEIRSFLGGRHKDDKGLYVSTGGFTKDAKYEADRASIPLTLMDIDDLVDLIIENYEDLDMETRTLLPLTRVYWPS